MTQERAVRSRRAIIEAAARVFARRGYEAATLQELIAASGLSTGAFYFHFSSKQQLALETMEVKQRQLIDAILTAVPVDAPPLQRLAGLFRARARLLEQDESLWSVLRLGLELGSSAGPQSPASAFNALPLELFSAIISEAQRLGEARPDLEARAAAEAVFAALIGMDSLSLQLAGGRDLTARTERLLDILLPGLRSGAN